MKGKRVAVGLAVLTLALVAVFPGRAAVQEYRFQKLLATLSESAGRNTAHIAVCLDNMCEQIDTALATEDVYVRRAALHTVAAWAQDCSDSLGEIDHYFDAYIQTKDRSYVGKYFTGDYEIRDGCLKLSGWLIPYITGERDTSENGFRETLLATKEDLLWLRNLWETTFSEKDSEQAFVAGFHEVFYTHEPEFARFFIEVHQTVESQND